MEHTDYSEFYCQLPAILIHVSFLCHKCQKEELWLGEEVHQWKWHSPCLCYVVLPDADTDYVACLLRLHMEIVKAGKSTLQYSEALDFPSCRAIYLCSESQVMVAKGVISQG